MKKYTFIFAAFSILSLPLFGQDWARMMKDGKTNFKDVQKAFSKWNESQPKTDVKNGGDKEKEDNKTSETDSDIKKGPDFADVLKTRTDSLDLSTRTFNALTSANIRTLGGLARKKREDLLEIEGIGEKGITEIKKVLNKFGLNLKE